MISDGWFDMTIFGMLIRWHLHTARLKWPETNEISSVTAPISTRSAVALLVTSSCLGCFTCLFVAFFFQLTYERSGPFLNVVCCAAKSTRKMSLCDLLSCFPQIEGTQTVVTTLEPLIEKSLPSYVGDDGHESWRYFFSHDSRVYLVWQYQPSLGQFSIFGECLHPGICVTISFHVFFYIKLGCTFGAIRGLTYIREDGRVPSLCCGW